ncbi:MAG: hypothetical protein Kow0013_22830 [Pararhodobacter sp.]
MTLIRAFSLIWMVLVLATGSVTHAMARHQVHAVDQVVICTGYGVVTVSVDADGNPTGPILPCPDSVPAAMAVDAGIADLVLAAPVTLTPVRFVLASRLAPVDGAPVHTLSRAPPVLV